MPGASVAIVVNIFLQSPVLQWLFGDRRLDILWFDRLRNPAVKNTYYEGDSGDTAREAIMGALQLYGSLMIFIFCNLLGNGD